MKKLLLVTSLATLAACAQADDQTTDDGAQEAGPGALIGAALITLPDGSQLLSASMEDGTTLGGPLTGPAGTWSAEGDTACITPGGDEVETFCFTYGPVQNDGTYDATTSEGVTAANLRPLYADLAAGEVAAFEAGAALVTYLDEEGGTGLSVWGSDGASYYAENPVSGAWRFEDGKRCSQQDEAEEETCGTPGEPGEDGSFTATPDDPELEPVTVMPIN